MKVEKGRIDCTGGSMTEVFDTVPSIHPSVMTYNMVSTRDGHIHLCIGKDAQNNYFTLRISLSEADQLVNALNDAAYCIGKLDAKEQGPSQEERYVRDRHAELMKGGKDANPTA